MNQVKSWVGKFGSIKPENYPTCILKVHYNSSYVLCSSEWIFSTSCFRYAEDKGILLPDSKNLTNWNNESLNDLLYVTSYSFRNLGIYQITHAMWLWLVSRWIQSKGLLMKKKDGGGEREILHEDAKGFRGKERAGNKFIAWLHYIAANKVIYPTKTSPPNLTTLIPAMGGWK